MWNLGDRRHEVQSRENDPDVPTRLDPLGPNPRFSIADFLAGRGEFDATRREMAEIPGLGLVWLWLLVESIQVIDAIKFNAGKMIQTMMLGVLVNPKP